MSRRLRWIAAAGLALAVAGCAGTSDRSGATPAPPGPSSVAGGTAATPAASPSPLAGGAPGSTVTGRYLQQVTRTAVLRPVGGGTVALYRYGFQPGANAREGSEAAGGAPVASAPIGADGRFVLRAVPDGVWFLTRPDTGAVIEGRWVKVTARDGAAVDLVGCLRCPPAQ